MDIKTRLECDNVLFVNFQNNNAKSRVLNFLNEKGIFTVEDFINTDIKNFPSTNRKRYIAMAHVFGNAYLGQDLPNDVLLQVEYKPEHDDDLVYIRGYRVTK